MGVQLDERRLLGLVAEVHSGFTCPDDDSGVDIVFGSDVAVNQDRNDSGFIAVPMCECRLGGCLLALLTLDVRNQTGFKW